MSHQDCDLLMQGLTNTLFEQVPADSCIHCAKRIVQKVDVCILIHSSRKCRETSGGDTTHSLGLTSEL